MIAATDLPAVVGPLHSFEASAAAVAAAARPWEVHTPAWHSSGAAAVDRRAYDSKQEPRTEMSGLMHQHPKLQHGSTDHQHGAQQAFCNTEPVLITEQHSAAQQQPCCRRVRQDGPAASRPVMSGMQHMHCTPHLQEGSDAACPQPVSAVGCCCLLELGGHMLCCAVQEVDPRVEPQTRKHLQHISSCNNRPFDVVCL